MHRHLHLGTRLAPSRHPTLKNRSPSAYGLTIKKNFRGDETLTYCCIFIATSVYMFPSLIFLYQSHFIFTFEYCYHLVHSLSPTILDKINGKPRPPPPPPQIKDGKMARFCPSCAFILDLGGGGGGGLLFHFILSKIVAFLAPDSWGPINGPF